MKLEPIGFPQALRLSGVLLLLGLCVEAVSLRWVHPLAFILFFVAGGTLLAAGVLLYLYSLVAKAHLHESQTQDPRP
jgi:hypothetical protein